MDLGELLEKYRELERRLDEKLARLEEENRRLREENERLRREGVPDVSAMDRLKEAYERKLAELQALAQEQSAKIRELEEELQAWRRLESILEDFLHKAPKPKAEVTVHAASTPSSPAAPAEDIARNLPPYEKEIYQYLAKHKGVPFTAYQIAVATRKSPKSSAFRTALSKLQKLGLIQRQGNQYIAR